MKKLALIALLAAFPLIAQAQEAPIKQIRRAAHERVYNDATRLAALLHDAQSNINYGEATWRAIANEANSLANRIYAGTVGNRTAHGVAKDIRGHVREMREAALKGDAAGARSHAAQALPFDYKIIDWAS